MSTSVYFRMTDCREQRRQHCHRLSRGADDLAMLLFTQPLETIATTCGAGFSKSGRICGEKGNAEKPDKLEQYLEWCWVHCQLNNFQQWFNFVHVQPWVYSLMATGLRKRAPEKNCCLLKCPWGPRRRGHDCLCTPWGVLTVPEAQGLYLGENPVPDLGGAGAGSGSSSRCLPHQQLSVQGGFWIGTVGSRRFYRQCHNCIRYRKNILKKPYSCTDFNKSVNPRENGIKTQVF